MDQKLLITKLKDIYIMMNSFVYTLTMDDYEKDDIVQNAMEIIYEKCHQLKDDDKLLDWAFMITKNVAKKYFKDNKKRDIPVGNSTDFARAEQIYVEEDIVLKLLEYKDLKEVLLDIMGQIDKKYQQVIYLRHYYDMSLQEIADVLGKNLSTIKSNYYRGLEQMKILLENKGEISYGR